MEYVQLVLIVLIGGGIIVAANYSGRNQAVAALVLTSLAFMNVLTILVALTLPFVAADEVESVWAGAGVLALTGAIGMLLLLEPIRRAISNWFPPRSELQSEASFVPSAELSTPTYPPMMSDGELITLQPQSTPASASHAPSITNGQPKSTELLGFDPRSLVHTVALVFCVYVFGNQLASFVLGGGLAGLAEEVEITAGTLIANFIPLLILPLLGVGLFVRRSWPQVLDRLGLGTFSWTSVAVGFGVALLLILAVYVVSIIWFLIVGQETFEEQNEASDAIAESINTLWLALGVSVTAAIGEEIAFRGALQPIFGLWWTAIFFTLVHMQYTLTPAALIILMVAIGLGWLRRRYNLYAAIAAHFLYNFIPLALSVLIES